MTDLQPVFAALRAVMHPFADRLVVVKDEPGHFYLDTAHVQKNNKPLFFGAVQRKKRYVSYHLMPVYVKPVLLDSLSPELRARMQGKSCFNFTTVDDSLLEELAALTRAGFEEFERAGFV